MVVAIGTIGSFGKLTRIIEEKLANLVLIGAPGILLLTLSFSVRLLWLTGRSGSIIIFLPRQRQHRSGTSV